ncbi:MAG TPA: pilus assembly protein TadG-related protein [Myxococcaceae bacterium]|jgi:hypothetical protein
MRALHRGQTLVLFALTLLLLTLLVTVTLTIGVKAKEKMELQAVADAAAYSSSVVVARTYNEIALMSRAQIGHMVSMAGVQSLISWSSYYRAQVEATRKSYNKSKLPYELIILSCGMCVKPRGDCKALCKCAKRAIEDIDETRDKLDQHQQQLKQRWESLDQAAGTQVKHLQGAAAALFGAQTERWVRMQAELNDQSIASSIVDKAKQGSRWPREWDAPSSGDDVSLREAGPFGAMLPVDVLNGHHVYAGMGSRGFQFVTRRSNGAAVLTRQLKQQIPQRDAVTATNGGSAYFASSENHGNLQPSGAFAWADDHGPGAGAPGTNAVVFNRGQPPCPVSSPGASTGVQAHVKSTDENDDSDEHRWSPGGDPAEEQERHTLGTCVRCPGIWPLFVDYNPLRLVVPLDNWGQPKSYAVIQRDLRKRNGQEPWNLDFNFRFLRGGDGTEFDNRGLNLSPINGGMDISRQTALSAGIAYYHRYDHWKEPPNLLNPYWRATLVPVDVDVQGEDDVPRTLGEVGAPWAAEAYRELRERGYRGGP